MVWAGATLDCILAGGQDEGPLVQALVVVHMYDVAMRLAHDHCRCCCCCRCSCCSGFAAMFQKRLVAIACCFVFPRRRGFVSFQCSPELRPVSRGRIPVFPSDRTSGRFVGTTSPSTCAQHLATHTQIRPSCRSHFVVVAGGSGRGRIFADRAAGSGRRQQQHQW